MAHQGFPEIERGHFRVRLVVQQPVERMVEGLYLAPVFTVAVHMERKARHRLRENTDAGIYSSHLQSGALIHRLTAGGAAKEKGKAAAAQVSCARRSSSGLSRDLKNPEKNPMILLPSPKISKRKHLP